MAQKRINLLFDEIRETINHSRSLILDTVELELGNTKGWSSIRTRLLRILGDRGLEGRLFQTVRDNIALFDGEEVDHE